MFFFFFSSRRRHTRSLCDWSSDVCSSDLVRADLVATEGWADVARAPEGPPARDRAVGDRGLEPVRLRDDPIRHESAVRAARDREAFGVDERILRGSEVHRLHEIEAISLAIVAPH